MHLPDRIFLIGMPGSGKSTLGQQLSIKLHYRFIDLDNEIENDIGKPIPQIFAEDGEQTFREVESKILRDSFIKSKVIVATGGGAPCFFDNIQKMNENGSTIFLDVPVDTLYQRIVADDINLRPKLSSVKDLKAVLANTLSRREVYYKKAHHKLTSSNITITMLEDLLEKDSKS